MAAELMLINPRRRARKTRRRSGGRRKLSPLQQKYFGKRRRRRAARAVTEVRTNPIRRRRRHRSRRRSIMRARRNPIRMPSTAKITGALVPAAIGAGGAIALNYAWDNWLAGMLPAQLQSGIGRNLAQIAAAFGIGMAGSAVLGKARGTQIAAGALTVTLFNMAQSYMMQGNAQIAYNPYATGSAGNYGWVDNMMANYGMAGLGNRRGRRMGRYVGMGGNVPRGLNRYVGMGGNVPRNLNGPRLGYIGPARTMGMGM